jgi:hypothetical protein
MQVETLIGVIRNIVAGVQPKVQRTMLHARNFGLMSDIDNSK